MKNDLWYLSNYYNQAEIVFGLKQFCWQDRFSCIIPCNLEIFNLGLKKQVLGLCATFIRWLTFIFCSALSPKTLLFYVLCCPSEWSWLQGNAAPLASFLSNGSSASISLWLPLQKRVSKSGLRPALINFLQPKTAFVSYIYSAAVI